MEKIKRPKVFDFCEKYSFLFFWLNWFYPSAKDINPVFKLYHLIPQKVCRNNGRVPWPVHKTSLVLHHKKIEVGSDSCPGLNIGCYVQGKGGIKIGKNLRMGPNVGLISANHSLENYDVWEASSPIEIGDNVWIGMNSVVMPGVKIGDNVVIGACSVVSKDIPSNCIAVGTPCRVVKAKEPYVGN